MRSSFLEAEVSYSSDFTLCCPEVLKVSNIFPRSLAVAILYNPVNMTRA